MFTQASLLLFYAMRRAKVPEGAGGDLRSNIIRKNLFGTLESGSLDEITSTDRLLFTCRPFDCARKTNAHEKWASEACVSSSTRIRMT